MKTDLGNEQRFIVDVDSFEFVTQDVEAVLRSLEGWHARLNAGLRADRLVFDGLRERSAQARQAEAIDTLLRNGTQTWSQQWADLEAARTLAYTFDDKVLLLVFGKFNAGKSAFCNFLARRFAMHGKTVRYFYLDAGHVVESAEPFVEGATETTARLQGVRLGEKLVLLDTPGLHSVTPENAALTQRFTDSADAVLWLTSSTSPGQVQELDELGRELHRNKPLLPVVTRSDAYDEDEIDGEIRKILCNKTAQNRALQEADVRARAEEKLVEMGIEPALLKMPVSISVYMAREQDQTPAAMSDAGFERLYAALLAIAEPTLAYKRRKLVEIRLHHLEEHVLGMLRQEVLPLLTALKTALQAAQDSLEQQQDALADAVWCRIVPTLPARLKTHAATRDVDALCNSLSASIFEAFGHEVAGRLGDYVVLPDISLARIVLDDGVGFEDIVVERDGASSERVSEVVGVDYGRLYVALEKATRRSLLQLSGDAAGQCRAAIRRSLEQVASLQAFVADRERDLFDLKRELRTESARVR